MEAGRNYGWPVITYGIEYAGPKIGEGTRRLDAVRYALR
ncbi:PQQ-dependent sugar dehydrogenase [Sphingobium cloacae]